MKAHSHTERHNLLNELDSLRELLDEYQEPEPPVLDSPVEAADTDPHPAAEEAITDKPPLSQAMEDIPVLSDAVSIQPEAAAGSPMFEEPAIEVPKLDTVELPVDKASEETAYVDEVLPNHQVSQQELEALIDERIEQALEPLRAELKEQLLKDILERFPLLVLRDRDQN